ncbi:unnamed protein product [Thlaspi arvense]|uniref:Uncharacterized protein n=1 Tax=Thlaspi arvense TaxID=13288 RepID=A0AAU9RK74_THLAR|nr:unnamed protein product [Thlaspi arvense]
MRLVTPKRVPSVLAVCLSELSSKLALPVEPVATFRFVSGNCTAEVRFRTQPCQSSGSLQRLTVKFSPFFERRLAGPPPHHELIGIIGNGRLHVLDLSPAGGPISEIVAFDTADGAYDLAWSESHDSFSSPPSPTARSSSMTFPCPLLPTRSTFHEHTRESHSVDYNAVRRDSFSPPPGTTPSNSGPSIDPPAYAPSRSMPTVSTRLSGTPGMQTSLPLPQCVLWDYMVEDALIGRYDHHTEFAVGLDMSVLVVGLLASTGWDELVYVWQHGTDPKAP